MRTAYKVLNIAHRGGAGLSPENTIYAFFRALNNFGADVIEMDVWSSSDGHPMVIHDETVDRTTDGSGKIIDMSLEELKRLDAAFHFTTDGGETYPLRGRGITIPTLREVFEAMPGVRMNIEIQQVRPPMEKIVYDLIMEYGMQDLVLVAAKNCSVRKRFKAVNQAGIATSASTSQGVFFSILSKIGLGFLYRPDFKALQFPEAIRCIKVITPGLVKDAHLQKKEVHAWIINEIENMKKLIEMGIDGIITDYPDRLREFLQKNGREID